MGLLSTDGIGKKDCILPTGMAWSPWGQALFTRVDGERGRPSSMSLACGISRLLSCS